MGKIPNYELGRFSAVTIGSSTGGPPIVEEILAGLPADLPLPLFIAQHMPPNFTETFAVHLDRASPLSVVHAEDGMPVFPGVVYIGVGKQHMRVRKAAGQIRLEINGEPQELLFKPSADELFRSASKVYSRSLLAVVLTGIGKDGLEGAQAIRECRGQVLVQSKKTCAVYGMPKSCAEAGAYDAQLDPDDIRRAILQLSPMHHKMAYT